MDVYSLVWDRVLPIPQIVTVDFNGKTTSLVNGANRAFAVNGTGTTGYHSTFVIRSLKELKLTFG